MRPYPLAYSLESQGTAEIDAMMREVQEHGAWVPATWVVEPWHGLLHAARRTGNGFQRLGEVWTLLRMLPIEVEQADPARVAAEVSPLAWKHQLTIYDATYLEVVLRRDLPLATRDNLRRAANQEGVTCRFFEPKPAPGV